MKLTVATLLWDANKASLPFSRRYTEEWVNRLYRGFERNLSWDFDFVCFVDRERRFDEPEIKQELIASRPLDYSACIEPYRLSVPMILVGLDTIVTGNIDHIAAYAFKKAGRGPSPQLLPRDPYRPARACNGVAVVPKGWGQIYEEHAGQNDMEWVRTFPHRFSDDIFPGQIVSYKGHVKRFGLGDARIVYFHGQQKPDELEARTPWIRKHWR